MKLEKAVALLKKHGTNFRELGDRYAADVNHWIISIPIKDGFKKFQIEILRGKALGSPTPLNYPNCPKLEDVIEWCKTNNV